MTVSETNQTGKSELAVQLYRSRGEPVRAFNITAAAEWSEPFDLLVGSYMLYSTT